MPIPVTHLGSSFALPFGTSVAEGDTTSVVPRAVATLKGVCVVEGSMTVRKSVGARWLGLSTSRSSIKLLGAGTYQTCQRT